jgi:hypothetical protein
VSGVVFDSRTPLLALADEVIEYYAPAFAADPGE